jgi:hypothetical protein
LLYAATIHLLAGAVTGSIFKVQTLLLWMLVISAEAAIASVIDLRTGAVWALANLSSIQIGYLMGILSRKTTERAGYTLPPITISRPR